MADDPAGRYQPNLLDSGVFSIILNHCDLPSDLQYLLTKPIFYLTTAADLALNQAA